jgi:hypothetical protein
LPTSCRSASTGWRARKRATPGGAICSTRAVDAGHELRPAPSLSNAEGVITATAAGGPVGSRLIDVLGESQPLTILGASAGVLEITIADDRRLRNRRTLSLTPAS